MKTILARLKEPSTWIGLISLGALVGISFSPDLSGAIVKFGVALGGLLAVVLPEGK